MLCAGGDGGRRSVLQTLCVWIVVIMWSNHVAEFKALGIDHLKCKSIVHVDASSAHQQ